MTLIASKSKGRVALLCQHFYPEMISTGMHMTELACALTNLGWQVTACCAKPSFAFESEDEPAPSAIRQMGIKVIRVPSVGSNSGNLVSRCLCALTYLIGSAWVVIRHNEEFEGLLITTNPPLLGLIGWLAKLLVSKPYIVVVYDVYPDIAIKLGIFWRFSMLAWIWERVSRLILNGAATIIVIGRDMRQVVSAKLLPTNRQKIQLIPNWADDRIVYPLPRDQNPFRAKHCHGVEWVIQYSGRMGRTHNLEALIGAADLLKRQDMVFQFIGEGATKQMLMTRAHQKGLTNLQFLPYQPYSKLSEVLSAADLAVVCLGNSFTGLSVPSKTYGIMASGTPILAFVDPRSEIGQTIIANNCGVVLPDPTASQVAQAIESLMSDPGRLRAMGLNGYRAFKNNYTLLLAASRYSELMHRIFN